MKKRIVKIIFGLLFFGLITVNFMAPKQNNSKSIANLEDIFITAQASAEGCIGAPGHNIGWCREQAGGGWYYCVEALFHNCYDD